jgi:hypothetical protein
LALAIEVGIGNWTLDIYEISACGDWRLVIEDCGNWKLMISDWKIDYSKNM